MVHKHHQGGGGIEVQFKLQKRYEDLHCLQNQVIFCLRCISCMIFFSWRISEAFDQLQTPGVYREDKLPRVGEGTAAILKHTNRQSSYSRTKIEF